MTLPAVYVAAAVDIGAAAGRIRERMKELAEPRLYQMAVMLTVVLRSNNASSWPSWDSPPPKTAKRFGKAELVNAMWELFGTSTGALIRPGSDVATTLDDPARVLLDVFYDANNTLLTLARRGPISSHKTRDGVKLAQSHPAWIWSPAVVGGAPSIQVVEYNPVNTLNQQNGIRCALPASAALAAQPGDPGGVYAESRPACPKRRHVSGKEPKCVLNDRGCGSMGNNVERLTTKPRLLAPPVPGADGFLVLPGTVETLIARATRGGGRLPAATDLSLLTSWCHTNGSGAQDATRLTQLLGADGLRLLTSRI